MAMNTQSVHTMVQSFTRKKPGISFKSESKMIFVKLHNKIFKITFSQTSKYQNNNNDNMFIYVVTLFTHIFSLKFFFFFSPSSSLSVPFYSVFSLPFQLFLRYINSEVFLSFFFFQVDTVPKFF